MTLDVVESTRADGAWADPPNLGRKVDRSSHGISGEVYIGRPLRPRLSGRLERRHRADILAIREARA